MSDNTIRTICPVFGVNEAWLKDGVGEMFPADVVPAAVDIAGIGVRIKEIRKREKLSQEQFGERIGFTKNHVYYVETGKHIPSDDFLNAVSFAFGVSYHWLKTGSNSEEELVNEELIAWLRRNPDVVRELRVRGGLDFFSQEHLHDFPNGWSAVLQSPSP